ncbi:bifunctional 2-polyprenyl-6-hydroxyphenol methylase/3-demethylubiquinol 3-O-methyltransferase UbiG [Paenibacillus sp. OV219]|uniref:class I SAM-dependent methyltransferase n=1 Tax=Paenibacillus sp. OV219 TaxID=1884377 RepID=UPI0008BB0DAC|nr:class I SAM-dependent methyltransferase [Paenibacillus sp. OV219]SEN49961.1 Methyltransferase domain-containing protein [Paenibacillus sp. OV219]
MNDSVLHFYDEIAEDYHLIFHDWNEAIARQGEILNRLIKSKITSQPNLTLLDCSCGIGTQAIGLAKHGYLVSATDISSASVKRAEEEAISHGVTINFGVADFRTLDKDVQGSFDIVLSADNAIPHLLTDHDLHTAFANFHTKLNQNGLLVATIRDYDALTMEKLPATQPRIFDEGKRIVFQVWDWAEDGKTYTVNQFILQEMNEQWTTKHYKTQYRALLREEINQLLRETGFTDIEWHLPELSGYYQPIVTARKY